MSDQTIRDALNEVVARVFQQTAFLFPEPADLPESMPSGDDAFIAVSLTFSGDRSGDICLILPETVCRELAANLLGEDLTEDLIRETALDAAKETLNIIAGQLLIQMYGDKALFNLSAPEVKETAPADIIASAGTDAYACSMVDGRPVLAALTPKTDVYEHTSTGR
ncbi:MAG: chemotaxis protein CheX [candidate division Zixibacteria bacterium]|nr:chemotaxis protein CheX [candidate division Zixibacteria bacterium]